MHVSGSGLSLTAKDIHDANTQQATQCKAHSQTQLPLLFADIVRTSSIHRKLMIGALARQAKKEMKAISSSALFRNKKALANFSWTTVWDVSSERSSCPDNSPQQPGD